MVYDVYVDLFFLINFSMDYICLYITSWILKERPRALRLILASTAGGIYSVASLFLNTNVFLSFVLDALVCVVMVLIAIYSKDRKKRSIIPISLLFTGISMLLGGVMTAIFNVLNKLDIDLINTESDGADTYIFAVIAIVSAIISIKGISFITKKNRHREYTVHISVNGKEASLQGFLDTGNLIHDQISDKSVIFVDARALSGVVPKDSREKFMSGELALYGSRLIPVSTANGTSLLLAFLPDSIRLTEVTHKKPRSFSVECFVALTDLPGRSKYEAVIPEDIIKLS